MTPDTEQNAPSFISQRRKREPKVKLPPKKSSNEQTADDWQQNQNRLQALHAKGLIDARKRDRERALEEREARKEANLEKYGRPVTSRSQLIDNVREEEPLPEVPTMHSLPARGPKVRKGTNVVESSGQVPTKRTKGVGSEQRPVKRVTAARERAQA